MILRSLNQLSHLHPGISPITQGNYKHMQAYQKVSVVPMLVNKKYLLTISYDCEKKGQKTEGDRQKTL